MRRVPFLTVLAVALGLTAVAAPVASALTDLPLTSFRDIVVDDAHGHVFLTGGGSTGVVVRNLDTSAATVVTDEPGADGMALSPDAAVLYVALSDADAVSAIDTMTLTETARYATGAGTCPVSVAATATAVWFGYGCSGDPGDIGVVDLSGPTVTLARAPLASEFATAPHLVLSPDATTLAAAEYDVATPVLHTLTTSGTTLAEAASRATGANLAEVAFSPDGTRIAAAATGDTAYAWYLTRDLTPVGTFGSVNGPCGVATIGPYVVGESCTGPAGGVHTYDAAGNLVRDSWFGAGFTALPRSVAVTANATVYAVTTSATTPYRLVVTADATRYQTFVDPSFSTHLLARPFTVSGRVGTYPPGPPASGVVHVQRRAFDYGDVRDLPDVTLDANGAFSFVDRLRRRGAYRYLFRYDGDATHQPSAAALDIRIVGLAPAMTIATDRTAYPWPTRGTVVAHLGPTHANRTLRLSITAYGSKTVVLRTAAVDVNGNLAAASWLSRRSVYAAYFAGDDVYEPRTVLRTVTVGVGVSEHLYDTYGQSGSYLLYHRTVESFDPYFGAWVTPDHPNTCLVVDWQQHYAGAWHELPQSKSCALTRMYGISSAAYESYTGPRPIGVPFRVRAWFPGDVDHTRSFGRYLYFRFTS